MSWSYCPLSIRLISKNDGNEVHNVTGVSLMLKDANTELLLYSLTVSCVPEVRDFDIYVSGSSEVSNSGDVKWYKSDVAFELEVVDEAFSKFLSYFKTTGFSFLPISQFTDKLRFTVIGLDVKQKFGQRSPIQFVDTDRHEPIEIVSFPFNISNPILFSEFKLSGHVNYVTPFGYFTDTRYIDNITGGVVNLRNKHGTADESLGLVMSNLKKTNGDGDLMFILSWKRIWASIFKQFPNNGHIPIPRVNKLSGTVTSYPQTVNSVLLLVIDLTYRQTWGSCVLFNHEYLITNYHVIAPYLDYPSKAKIYLNSTDYLQLTKNDYVITKFKDIDLAFIQLSLSNQFKLSNKSYSPINYTLDYDVSDDVHSVGYGLFFNEDMVQPIDSQGLLLAKRSSALQINKALRVPAMLITSASCWNGSSGGALLKRDNFIGLICSNAQIKNFDVRLNDFKSEKLSTLCFILPIETILECFKMVKLHTEFELHYEFKNLWNLQDTFKNYYIDPRKLKL